MVTNISGLKNATTFYDILVFTNDVTNGLMSMMFMIVIFVILSSMFINRYSFVKTMMVSSFACFGLSIMLVAINLLNFWFIIGFGTMLAMSAFYIQLKE